MLAHFVIDDLQHQRDGSFRSTSQLLFLQQQANLLAALDLSKTFEIYRWTVLFKRFEAKTLTVSKGMATFPKKLGALSPFSSRIVNCSTLWMSLMGL